MKPIVLAADIGGSKLVVGLVEEGGNVLCKRRTKWTALDAEHVIADVIRVAREVLQAHPQHRALAMGITIPGLADPSNGIWVEASFSGIRGLPMARLLEDALKLPVYLDNDAQACARAEMVFGAGRDGKDFLYMTVSNGIGGAICAGGQLLTGCAGNAGEIGHCTVVPKGRTCKCGKQGCLEAYAAGPGLARTYAELGGKPAQDGNPLQGAEIAHCARQGEKAAKEAMRLEGEYLGTAIAFAANLLNPARVILGGGLSLAFETYEASLQRTVEEQLYGSANLSLEILPTALGYDGGLLGAAAVALSNL